MEQSPSWEDNSRSGSRDVPHLLWNPKVHYSVHKSPHLVPIMSQVNPAHIFPPHFPNIHSSVISPSTPRSSMGYFPSGFPTTLITPMRATCLDHLILLDFNILVIFSEAQELQISLLCPLLQLPSISPLRPKYSSQHPVLKQPQSMFFP
jgi:hypothetical protein